MVCWYCYWGWPKVIADIYIEAAQKLSDCELLLDFGPGHIVWSDENWDCAQWCLDHFDDYKNDDGTEAEYAVVRESLEKLVLVWATMDDPVPADYDGLHPENYPPQIEMVRI